jgi:peptide/nickel transport system substrate-binding protein
MLSLGVLLSACGGGAAEGEAEEVEEAESEAEEVEEAESEAEEAEAEEAEEAEMGEAQMGGTLTVAVPATPTGYPILQAGGLADNVVGKFLNEGLTRYSRDSLTPEPALAEDWSTNDDTTEWTFNLRQDVTWHDGEPFTADDVKFTFELVVSDEVRARSRGQVAALESVEVIDDYTVTMTFSEPHADLPIMLAYNMGIVPEHILAGEDPNEPTTYLENPIGTGPFKFVEGVSGSHWVMERNEDWWGGDVYLDQVVMQVVPDINTTVAQLKAGDIDVALIQPAQAASFDGDENVSVEGVPQVNYFYLSLMNNVEPWDNVRMRQALNYAVDKEAIIDTLLAGYGSPAVGPITPVIEWAYTDDVTRYPYDPDTAIEILAEEGWEDTDGDSILDKDGAPLTVELSTSEGVVNGPQLAEVLQQYLADVGVESTVNLVEFRQLWVGLFEGEFESSVEYLVSPPTPDLINDLGCEAGRNRYFYCNPDADELLVQARSTTDQAARAELYAEYQQLLANEPPGIYLYYPLEMRAVNNRVHDFPSLPFREAFFHVHDIWVEG